MSKNRTDIVGYLVEGSGEYVCAAHCPDPASRESFPVYRCEVPDDTCVVCFRAWLDKTGGRGKLPESVFLSSH